jgi:hypothetical protein
VRASVRISNDLDVFLTQNPDFGSKAGRCREDLQ